MPTSPLFDFSSSSPDDPSDWRSIDDPVMGGVSESCFVATDDGAAFAGTVSLKQGGGFASVRAPESKRDLSGAEGRFPDPSCALKIVTPRFCVNPGEGDDILQASISQWIGRNHQRE
ncbi:MAG: hypothetical protein BRD30_05030 [Bacteroidetes bacterium QH_2_63_10]|nr:MAG: hypothetical protein BRD30_05030 [Bacteroidetes bacterium QH_2_63_10]